MQYLTDAGAIRGAIARHAEATTLWLDTEVADYRTAKPRLSLIQVLDDPGDTAGDRVCMLDVLEQPELVEEFIGAIASNPAIEKVFHNASYDLQFLGGKRKAKNVTCTLAMAKKIPYYLAPLPNQKLKTLAAQLCNFTAIDTTEQTGDWGMRPLTGKQLHYAKMDSVYVAQVHHRLLKLAQLVEPEPETEDIAALTLRYRQIEERWKHLDTEMEHIKKRLKQAMEAQKVLETKGFKLTSSKRTKKKVSFSQLAKVVETAPLEGDFSIELTKDMQKHLTEVMDYLPVEEETTTYSKLSVEAVEDEDLPF